MRRAGKIPSRKTPNSSVGSPLVVFENYGGFVSLEDLANIGEAVGGLAVLVTLIYLALQLRQNTRAMRAATYEQVVRSTTEWSEMLARDDAVLAVWIKSREGGLDGLTKFERSKYFFTLTTFMRRAESVHYQETQGTLEPEAWQGIRDSIQGLLDDEAATSWWKENRFRFRDAFRDFIDNDLLA